MDANSLLQTIRQEGRSVLLYPEAKNLLDLSNIPVVQVNIARNQEEAVQIAKSIGFPVVMKIFSPDVVHKSDSGGVAIDLRNEKDVIEAFGNIMESCRKEVPSARIHGVFIEKMVSGVEVIIGVTNDAQFGHVLMFGMGGVLVELFKDVSFRLIPIEAIDAKEMMEEVKGYPLLQEYRGRKGNVEALEDILIKVSNLITRHPEIVEMDLNPVFASISGCLVGDARIIIDPEMNGCDLN